MSRAALLWPAFAICAVLSCDSDEPSALSLLGGSCRLNSDCTGGLACAYGVCHQECATSKDCEDGRCILDQSKVHYCQPKAAATCTFNSDCLEPLLCARDEQCRNECAADRDCVSGQRCIAATCAEPEELDASGNLPPAGDPLGKPCTYASDCLAANNGLTLVCNEGACTYACFEERDCGRFLTCSTADDPMTPGNCDYIGPIETLVCDPDFDEEARCFCPGAPSETVPCRQDGQGYEECCP